jgi:hypothetical protein
MSKSHHKKSASFLGGILFICLVIILGALFIKHSQTKKPVISNLNTVWDKGSKTYANQNVNIKFEYPSEFSFEESTPSAKFSTTQIHSNNKETCASQMQVGMERFDNKEGKSLLDFISVHTNDFTKYQKSLQKADLPYVGAHKFDGYIYVGEKDHTSIKEVYFKNKDQLYKFTLQGCQGQPYTKEADQVLQDILTSIEFN